MNHYLQETLLLLKTDIHTIYRKIISSRYFSPAHLEVLSLEAKKSVDSIEKEKKLFGYLACIYEITHKAFQDDQYLQNERRIMHVIDTVSSYCMEELSSNFVKNERPFIKVLYRLFMDNHLKESSPYPALLIRCISSLKMIRLIITHFLQLIIKRPLKRLQWLLVTFFLFIGKERLALNKLTMHTDTIQPQDVELHIQLLAKRERFSQIVEWITVLFPTKRHHLGSLQASPTRLILLTITIHYGSWDRWLQAPSYNRFKTLSSSLSKNQLDSVLNYILPKMAPLLYTESTKLTYVQLLNDYSYFQEAQHYFLNNEPNPIALHETKLQLLKKLAENEPRHVLPVYHQFIIRLAEKRSRKYYMEAADYVFKLADIYTRLDETAQFQLYLFELKKGYKTYRAFIEELKRRESKSHMDT
ncbi:LOW QUALITY PROTEIN: hypothetical protein JCM19046_4045 [Bacillus sp. JCM 19046]|nr:LOW QUALITY PROTEIN: hypothetical protein JCM19046_4045 [Bacillus sp. JCM 19046]